jgi:hypothetical protein
MVSIKPTNPNKTCSLCGNRVRGKGFVFYDDMPSLDQELRECIPICKECDSRISVYDQTLSIWYGLYRIASIRVLKKEERKKRKKC